MKRKAWIISSFLTMAIVLMGCNAQTTSSSSTTTSNPSSSTPTTRTSVPAAVDSLETTLESIFAQVSPSVVLIQVTIPATGSEAQGSGFVWDTQGDIITNNHVVAGASTITVTFSDGTVVDASLVGADSDSDLAVIKVNPGGFVLQPVTMGDSASVKVGQLSIAIGNPFGLENTMTIGFISAVGRLVSANQTGVGPTYNIPDILQSDAPINPGNSGGVLLDDTGAVIGITQSIESESGSSSGIGFAIPSAIIKQVVPALITSGHYAHPYLGIGVISLDPDLSTAMNLPSTQRGALVETVTAGGPGDTAGLKASSNQVTINGQQIDVGGDVIIAYNGQTVKTSDDLITFLANSGVVGQTVTLTVLRGGQQIQVQVTVGVRPTS